MDVNEITANIVDSSIKIHNIIGPGCYEKVYEEILYYELTKRGVICTKANIYAYSL